MRVASLVLAFSAMALFLAIRTSVNAGDCGPGQLALEVTCTSEPPAKHWKKNGDWNGYPVQPCYNAVNAAECLKGGWVAAMSNKFECAGSSSIYDMCLQVLDEDNMTVVEKPCKVLTRCRISAEGCEDGLQYYFNQPIYSTWTCIPGS